MTKSKGRKRKKRGRFESAGTLVLGRTRARRRPAASRVSRLRGAFLLLLATVLVGASWMTLDKRFYIY
ncbi:MAG: hypothetical protein SXV54_08550, partial [Chloroflexota bacterium]|nr:hypothetical protein [Chloroflexota bacterium]